MKHQADEASVECRVSEDDRHSDDNDGSLRGPSGRSINLVVASATTPAVATTIIPSIPMVIAYSETNGFEFWN